MLKVKDLKKMVEKFPEYESEIEHLIEEKDDEKTLRLIDRNDYFASKLWCREDIASQIENLGYEVTPENVSEVINAGGNWAALNDCQEFEWDAIGDVIFKALHPRAQDAFIEKLKALGIRDEDEKVALYFKESNRYFLIRRERDLFAYTFFDNFDPDPKGSFSLNHTIEKGSFDEDGHMLGIILFVIDMYCDYVSLTEEITQMDFEDLYRRKTNVPKLIDVNRILAGIRDYLEEYSAIDEISASEFSIYEVRDAILADYGWRNRSLEKVEAGVLEKMI